MRPRMRSQKPEDKDLTDKELREKYGGWLHDPFSDDDITPALKAAAIQLGYRKMPLRFSRYVLDNYFLGDTSISGKGLFDAWKVILEQVFPSRIGLGCNVLSINSGLGTGKTTVSKMILSYIEHRVDCLDHQRYIRGMSDKDLVIGLIHKSTEKANTDLKEPLERISEESTYWESGRISHNNVEYKLGGQRSIQSILGSDVIAATVSESDHWDNLDKSYDTLKTIYGRLTSRLSKEKMKWWGLMIVDSSPAYGRSVVKEFIDTVPDVMRVEMSSWDAKPGDYWKEGEFYVYMGDINTDPFVFDDDFHPDQIEEGLDKDKVMKIPRELYSNFIQDTKKSLQDYAGITTELGNTGGFIKDRMAINKAMCLPHSNKDVVEVDFYDPEERLFDLLSTSILKIPKDKFVYVGIDIGITNDLTGIAIGYFDDYVYPFLKNENIKDEKKKALKEPTFIINTVVGVSRKKGQETSLSKIKDLIFEIAKHYEIGGVCSDTHQSRQLIQEIEKAEIPTKFISVDRKPDPYVYLKNAIYAGRVKLPSSDWLRNELLGLEYSGNKIDHKKTEGSTIDGLGKWSKDIADATAGVLYYMFEDLERSDSISSKYSMRKAGNILSSLYDAKNREIHGGFSVLSGKDAQEQLMRNLWQ